MLILCNIDVSLTEDYTVCNKTQTVNTFKGQIRQVQMWQWY